MRRLKAQPVIETMRVRSRFVGRQLNDPAILTAAFFENPGEHRFANLLAAPIACHAHRFNQATLQSAAGKASDERQLKRPDNLGAVVDNEQELVRVGIDDPKSIEI